MKGFIRRIFFSVISGALAVHSFKDETVTASFGEVTLRVYGDNTPSSDLVVCIPGMNAALVYEWATVAEPLSKHGYLTVIVNLHGHQKKLKAVDMAELIDEQIVKKHFQRNKYILMGKSWGGGVALEVAMMKASSIHKLAVIAPAAAFLLIPKFLLHSDSARIPFFLGWATDDPITTSWSLTEWRTTAPSGKSFITKEIPAGGHVVNSEYADDILKFLKL